MFDKSLWTASGPGKQREMRLQVKKELRDFKTFGHLKGQFTK